METWFLILVSISISLLLKAFHDLLFSPTEPTGKSRPTLPPGPPIFPVIGNIVWLRRNFSELEPVLRSLHSKLGPIVSLRLASRPSIFIADRSLAHQALVQNGAVFADRPKAVATNRIASSNQKNISSAPYGATWRLLRRNLTAEILHPSRVKSYSHARKWVLKILIDRLAIAGSGDKTSSPVQVVDHFHYAMFCLLVLMCFGDKLEEEQIKDIERVERNMILNVFKYNILNLFPKVTRLLFRKKWEEFLQLRKDQEDVLIPLIRARKDALRNKKEGETLAYVDTLFDLVLPEDNRNLNDDELVTLCNEFLNAGTDTTSTSLQWIMARLVKHPDVQDRIYSELKRTVGPVDEIAEEQLGEMTYLKAVVLEGLRRHPPGHFVLPHAVTDDVELGGHLVPRSGTVNFMVADMGWDPEVWSEPMEFRPDRFVGKEKDHLDITGSKGIKMMPFGVGRRMCPAYGLAMLHLEYFVANLVWRFEWKEVEGVGVDLSEKQEFTMVMKFPLQARLVPRFNGVR